MNRLALFLSVVILSIVPPTAGQTNQEEPGVELENRTPPMIESAAALKSKYHAGETFEYAVRIKWDRSPESVRMASPEMALSNLELLGVGQETISSSSLENPEQEQILRFRFRALRPGSASIDRMILQWIEQGGESAYTLEVPAVHLSVSRPKVNVLRWLLFSSIVLIVIGSIWYGLAKWKHFKHKSNQVQEMRAEPSETIALKELKSLQEPMEKHGSEEVYLKELARIIQRYVTKELDWNPKQEDYNALRKKAENKWTAREGEELAQVFKRLELIRFSGPANTDIKPKELFQAVYSFIDRKRVI